MSWRCSVSECLAVIDFLDARLEPLDRELKPFAHADPRAALLDTIPGVAELLALTIAVEIGDISRFAAPTRLVSYGRLAPRVHQSGQARPRSGPLSKSGSRLLGWAAVEAAQQAWRESNPWHDLYLDVGRRSRHSNSAKAAVARKILIATRHILSRNEPFKPTPRTTACTSVPASSPEALAARRPLMEVRSRDSSHRHGVQPSAKKEPSVRRGATTRRQTSNDNLTSGPSSERAPWLQA